MLSSGKVIEAWQGSGVRQIPNPMFGHSKGTIVDVFGINAEFNEVDAEMYLRRQIGQDYDYSSVFRFVTRRKAANNEKKFCSELAELALINAGLKLLNGNPSEHSPRDTVLSPYLRYENTLE